MIHLAAGMVILVLTHVFCLAVMTERKYSIRKTALIYAVFSVLFIGLTLAVFALFGSGSPNTAFTSFSSTILMAFFMFILTSADAFCKNSFFQRNIPADPQRLCAAALISRAAPLLPADRRPHPRTAAPAPPGAVHPHHSTLF